MKPFNFELEVVKAKQKLIEKALRLTRDKDKAEDLVQETVFKALTNKDKFRENTNLHGWLYTILKNIFINEYNRNVRHPMVYQDSYSDYFLNQGDNITHNEGLSNMTMQEIQASFDKIDKKYTEPFLMHYKGFKYEEIAEKEGVPLGTIKTRIHKARKLLQEKLKHVA